MKDKIARARACLVSQRVDQGSAAAPAAAEAEPGAGHHRLRRGRRERVWRWARCSAAWRSPQSSDIKAKCGTASLDRYTWLPEPRRTAIRGGAFAGQGMGVERDHRAIAVAGVATGAVLGALWLPCKTATKVTSAVGSQGLTLRF